jgi:hypothetical protein
VSPLLFTHIATCATPDLLLKHPSGTLATYISKQMKHLKHASETLAKIHENHCKHMQYPDKILVTYV